MSRSDEQRKSGLYSDTNNGDATSSRPKSSGIVSFLVSPVMTSMSTPVARDLPELSLGRDRAGSSPTVTTDSPVDRVSSMPPKLNLLSSPTTAKSLFDSPAPRVNGSALMAEDVRAPDSVPAEMK